MSAFLIAQIVLTLFVFVMLLSSAAVMVYAERKVAAILQQRMGPYLVGPKGMLQPLADVIKLMFKEELRPKAAVAEIIGASAKRNASAARGRSSSLNISLMTSASGWSAPLGPTRYGPTRCWSIAATLRST